MKKKILALVFALVIACTTIVVVMASSTTNDVDIDSFIQNLDLPEDQRLVYVILMDDGSIYTLTMTSNQQAKSEAPIVITEAELDQIPVSIIQELTEQK